MIKSFGQWVIAKDGIQTIPGCGYYWISKEDVMAKNTVYAKELLEIPTVNNASLIAAFKYAYKYFHAMTKLTSKSDSVLHSVMMDELNELVWYESKKGLTATVPEGFNITVFQDDSGKWKWVYDEIFSSSSYKNSETAKKKAYASYFWLYNHIKKTKGLSVIFLIEK